MVPRAADFLATFRALAALRFFRYAFIVSALFVLLAAALPAWKVLPLSYGSEVVPIHYNIHYGVDKTGPWWRLFTLPAFALIVLVLNAVLSTTLWKHDHVLARYVAGMTVVVAGLAFIAMIFVVLLNMSYG